MLALIKRFAGLYFTEILGFCLMGNHFHLLVKMIPQYQFSDGDIHKRFERFYGDSRTFAEGQIPYFLEKEHDRAFELNRSDRFRYRTRYFTDSGVIGSKAFVSKTYQRFKHVFASKNEKKPIPVKGLSGVYSLKRLSEAV